MEDNWFPAFSLPECVPDGCVYMRWAAYEFRIMMDGWMKSKEHETVYATTLYISIHLLLMQQPQHWGSGTLCWRPNESWVIYHVESQSSSPASMPYTTPSWFFYLLLFPPLHSFIYTLHCFPFLHFFLHSHFFPSLSSSFCLFPVFPPFVYYLLSRKNRQEGRLRNAWRRYQSCPKCCQIHI